MRELKVENTYEEYPKSRPTQGYSRRRNTSRENPTRKRNLREVPPKKEVDIVPIRTRQMPKKRKRKKKKSIFGRIIFLIFIMMFTGGGLLCWKLYSESKQNVMEVEFWQDEVVETVETFIHFKNDVEKPDIVEDFLPVNEFSRPGDPLEHIDGVVIHYTANPGTSAKQNRDYFAGLAISGETSASSHFVIGLDGEIIQCIPLDEISYASNDRNHDTVSIECCIADDSGKFNEATYQSVIKLTAWLMGEYRLTSKSVIRHYDITGKMCPKYYVEHEDEWIQLKKDIVAYKKACQE